VPTVEAIGRVMGCRALVGDPDGRNSVSLNATDRSPEHAKALLRIKSV
jgi:hypothetical protein